MSLWGRQYPHYVLEFAPQGDAHLPLGFLLLQHLTICRWVLHAQGFFGAKAIINKAKDAAGAKLGE